LIGRRRVTCGGHLLIRKDNKDQYIGLAISIIDGIGACAK
jgi:hypothetical protein